MEPSVACPSSIVTAYINGTHCDLEIVCGTLTFNVHKLVVCTSCDFFKKGAEFAEAEERRITLPEDDPGMIHRLITYLYVGDYEPCASSSLYKHGQTKFQEPAAVLSRRPHAYDVSNDKHEKCACLARKGRFSFVASEDQVKNQVAAPLSIHADMYTLGDKYQVAGLCSLATSKFSACLAHHWSTPDFITAVQKVYSSTPDSNRGLRDVVVKAFRDFCNTDIRDNPLIEEKLHAIDELSFELLKSWPSKAAASRGGLFSASSPAVNTVISSTSHPLRSASSNTQPVIDFGTVATPANNSRTVGGLFGVGSSVAQQNSTPQRTTSPFVAPHLQASSTSQQNMSLFGGGASRQITTPQPSSGLFGLPR